MKWIKTYVLALFLFQGFALWGQEPVKNEKKWKFGLILRPGLSHKMPAIDYRPYDPCPIESLDYQDRTKLSYAGGFCAKRSISLRSALEFSFIFIDRGYKASGYICWDGYFELTCVRMAPIAVYYIDMPITYNLKLLHRKKIHFFIETGLLPSIYLFSPDGLGYMTIDNNQIIIIFDDNYKPVALSCYTSVKAALKLSKRLLLETGPCIQFGVMDFTGKRDTYTDYEGTYKIAPPYYKYYPYFLGLDMSFYLTRKNHER